MRVPVLVACILFAAPAGAARQQLDTLTPDQAISRAAAVSPKPVRALFQFKVQNAVRARGGYYLDSERDFHSPRNLSVTIRPSAMAGLTAKYGEDLRAAFTGKTIKLIGEVRKATFGKTHNITATEIEITTAGQILAVS